MCSSMNINFEVINISIWCNERYDGTLQYFGSCLFCIISSIQSDTTTPQKPLQEKDIRCYMRYIHTSLRNIFDSYGFNDVILDFV